MTYPPPLRAITITFIEHGMNDKFKLNSQTKNYISMIFMIPPPYPSLQNFLARQS